MGHPFFPGDLESWFDEQARDWWRPGRREFHRFFQSWRETFESQFQGSRSATTGPASMAKLESKLPIDAVVFCEPAYRHLPSGGHSFYAFQVSGLQAVDRDLLNTHDAVVADIHLEFCCVYTHEIGSLADPTFWLAEAGLSG